jgi:hypothetical protein
VLSYINLIEAYVLATIRRKYTVSMTKVRKAIDYVGREFKTDHPLADKEFETDGPHIFVREYGNLINIIRDKLL